MTVSPEILAQLPLLKGLDRALLTDIGQHMWLKEFANREFVFHKGSTGEELAVVLQGRLLVFDTAADGRQTGLNFLVPGDFFGELAVIDDQPRSASIITASPSLLAFMGKDAARKLIYETPLVAERMLKHLASRLRVVSGFRAVLSIPHAPQRVFALVRLLANPPAAPDQPPAIENLPTHEQIALMANTSRETVTRSLHVLQVQHIIQMENRRIIICKPAELTQMVEGAEAPKPVAVPETLPPEVGVAPTET